MGSPKKTDYNLMIKKDLDELKALVLKVEGGCLKITIADVDYYADTLLIKYSEDKAVIDKIRTIFQDKPYLRLRNTLQRLER